MVADFGGGGNVKPGHKWGGMLETMRRVGLAKGAAPEAQNPRENGNG